MEIQTYLKIKKHNPKVVADLVSQHIKRAWFICYHLTENTSTAAPLLINSFKESFDIISTGASPPGKDFKHILNETIFQNYLNAIESEKEFEELNIPKTSKKYQFLVDELLCLSEENRGIYLMFTYGSLTERRIAEILGIKAEAVQKNLRFSSDTISRQYEHLNIKAKAENITISAEFKSPSNQGFSEIVVPDILKSTIYNALNKNNFQGEKKMANKKAVSNKKPINSNRPRPKSKSKAKIIVLTTILVVVFILGVIFIPKIFSTNTALTVTTYNIEAITSGNVDTTISGSGTLTPISKDTITTAKAGTVTTLNYEVGATVEEDAVIAVLTDDSGNKTEFTAPYDGVLIELPISKDDELTANSQIAMIMGTDGFTMGIAVDELDISTVKVGQEVSFTIDAVKGSYDGSVTAVSYNGTESGGTTAYQITAKVDYVEGVYPGMSASAEIIIESSGEGLLVPTSAIYTSGDENYIYLAPSGAEKGTEYQEDEINIEDLTKITVETGMSDGSYTIIESDAIAEGDLIVITTLTSTQTETNSQNDRDGFGGMGGGRGPGGGGMDFGDFDFENFDPSGMPGGGGGFPGGMGGN